MEIGNKFEPMNITFYKKCETYVTSTTDPNNILVPRKTIACGIIIITKDAIHLTTNFKWLCESLSNRANDSNHVTKFQPMANLVEVENLEREAFTLVFMNELECTIEKWILSVDTYSRSLKLIETTDEIWSKIFSVPLLAEDQYLS